MTEKQELLLKEIEELRENYYQGINERKKIYKEKKIEIEGWRKLREEGKETVFPIERITELDKEEKKESEKFDKAVKEKMLDDLSSWALDPQGFFYRANGRLKTMTIKVGDSDKNYDMITFENHPNSKYRNEVVNRFIEEIKQNPQDWKIEKEDDAIYDKTSWGGCFVVKHKSGRKHYRPFPLGYKNRHNLFGSFSLEEWAKIENVLNNQVEKEKNSQNQFQKIDNKVSNKRSVYYWIGTISLVILSVSVVVIWAKRRKKLK